MRYAGILQSWYSRQSFREMFVSANVPALENQSSFTMPIREAQKVI